MDPAVASATFAGIGALTTVITATVAVSTLVRTQRDSRDRARPLVVARVRRGPSLTHGTCYLVVRNAGASVARDVSVSFDPPLPNVTSDEVGNLIVGPMVNRRYDEPIEVLAPGERLSNVWRYYGDEREGIPARVVATVSYCDDRGRTYSEKHPLLLEPHLTESTNTPASKDYPKRVAVAVEAAVMELWAEND